jgi:hypothetical protein
MKTKKEVVEIMLYFENRKEYDKYLILLELKSHYKLESMKRILNIIRPLQNFNNSKNPFLELIFLIFGSFFNRFFTFQSI